MEILGVDTSTKGSLNWALFNKISKSGDGGASGGSLHTKVAKNCQNKRLV